MSEERESLGEGGEGIRWRRRVERKNEVGKIIILFLCSVIQPHTWNCLLIVRLDLKEK